MLSTGARRQDAKLPELRVAVLCSRRAPGLTHLLEAVQPGRWRIVVGVTSDPESEMPGLLRDAEVPALVHDILAFYRGRGQRWSDLTLRPAYDRATGDLLRPYRPDVIVLCGYLHVVTAPLLDAFPGRIVNIHDADLTLRAADGRPKYRGLRSTSDAVFAGEPETRCSVHLVTADVDVGPLLLRSGPFPVHPLVADARRWGAVDILKAYAYAQREWMMRAAWGPLLERAIELFAGDALRLHTRRLEVEAWTTYA